MAVTSAVEAALQAIEQRTFEAAEKLRQVELSLKHARYEVAHARRQYDAVDPDNHLVASELERRWNDKLIDLRRIEDELKELDQHRSPILDEQEREHLMRLGADMEIAWSHPAATMATRKRIVRTVLREIIVRVEDGFVDMVLHWQGGDHTALKIKKNAFYVTREEFRTAATTLGFKPATLRQWRRRRAIPAAAKSRLVYFFNDRASCNILGRLSARAINIYWYFLWIFKYH
jgi:hypothetical protein